MTIFNYFKAEKGFTLMELLVTVILVAVLASYSVYYYNNTLNEGKLHAAKGKLAALGGAMERYKIENPNAIDECLILQITEARITEKSCEEGSGAADRALDVFRCGYAEKSLGFDDNFFFYFGCPHAEACGGSYADNTAYMKPKVDGKNDVFPSCAYFDPNTDKVIEVRD